MQGNSCKSTSSSTPPLDSTSNLCERVHVDHAQWKSWLLFVAVDAFSKWPEVFVVNSTSAAQTTDKLCPIFATHGSPVTLVSDNGPPFSSADFQNFMSSNGILHRRLPPYHPSSNGLVENMVRSLKRGLNKVHRSDSIGFKIAKFLATYRATPHSVTGRALAELLLGRLPRIRLSLIHACVSLRLSLATEQRVDNRSLRVFKVGQAVLLRDLWPTATQKWRAAIVLAQQGPLIYKVVVDGQVRQAHVDHLKTSSGNNATLEQPNNLHTAEFMDGNPDSVPNPFLLTSLDGTEVELTCNSPHSSAELSQRPRYNCRPPKMLIEEMD